jgi:hypothetical protein
VTGKGHPTMRQPPACLTGRLCALIQARTAWLTCHEAFSQTSRRAVLPSAANQAVSQASHGVVPALTGRPWTKRRSLPCVAARHSPYHATALGAGSCRSGSFGTRGKGWSSVQVGRLGWARRLPQTASCKPKTPSACRDARALSRSRPFFCVRRTEQDS